MNNPPNAVKVSPPSLCPECGSFQSGAASIGGEKAVPNSGDASICKECGCICEYDVFRRLVKATPDRMAFWKLSDPKRYDRMIELRMLIQRRNAHSPRPPEDTGRKH